MPPKRSRTTRRQNIEVGKEVQEVASSEPKTEDKVEEVNGEIGKSQAPTSSKDEAKENGAKVNGKAGPKSAASKKREKRKQRKREGSVMSEISDAETVLAPKTSRSLMNL